MYYLFSQSVVVLLAPWILIRFLIQREGTTVQSGTGQQRLVCAFQNSFPGFTQQLNSSGYCRLQLPTSVLNLPLTSVRTKTECCA